MVAIKTNNWTANEAPVNLSDETVNLIVDAYKTCVQPCLLKNKLQNEQTTIYVCQNKVCKLPVSEMNKAFTLVEYQ